VCNENDVAENEMKNFDFHDSKVLIVKQNGRFHAVGAKCSHYNALLSTGVLGKGRVRCPWHGACFSLETGDIEDYPGQDSIPCFQVSVEQGLVNVRAKKSQLQSQRRIKEMTKFDPNNSQTFVIIGGGPSGLICCETLRQIGFDGRIILICKEKYLPYDRVKVSKMMDSSPESILLRPQEFYNDSEIETLLGVEAKLINFADKEISLSNGNVVKYDKTYIATGSSAYRPDISKRLPLHFQTKTLKNCQFIFQ
jgi:apoptosis-inducing factor 3